MKKKKNQKKHKRRKDITQKVGITKAAGNIKYDHK